MYQRGDQNVEDACSHPQATLGTLSRAQLRRFNYILAHEEDLDANEREKPLPQQHFGAETRGPNIEKASRCRFVDFVYKSILSSAAWPTEASVGAWLKRGGTRVHVSMPGWHGCADLPRRYAVLLPRAWWLKPKRSTTVTLVQG